jgi:hypothetical protein
MDAGTGAPLAGVQVSTARGGGAPAANVTTDEQGRYSLRDIPPGQRRVAALARDAGGALGPGPSAARLVTLQPGQDLTGINIRLRSQAEISGRVYDANKEPIPDIRVALIAREYTLGAVRYVFASMSITDDQGDYHLQRVEPGRAYLVVAQRRPTSLRTISDEPAEPKNRRPVPVPTYYPNSNIAEGGQPLVLRVGEHREGVDIRMARSANYCVSGVIEGPNGPAPLQFQFVEAQPTSGSHGNGATFVASPRGRAGDDGKVRICNLHPGDYELTTFQSPADPNGAPPFYTSATVTVSDRDVQNVRLSAIPPIKVPGEVSWFGAAPNQPAEGKLTIDLRPLTRAPWGGEFRNLNMQSTMPGEFAFPGLLADEYAVSFRGVPPGCYIKDATYNNRSVLYEPLRAGAASADEPLRLVLARDGGKIAVRVADKDNNLVGDATVVLIPADAGNEPSLAASFHSGQTDQNGAWTSGVIAPGKYYAIALTAPVDRSPESIGKLLRSRNRAEEVDLAPNGSSQVTLEPKTLE